jgi:hypothetical protein
MKHSQLLLILCSSFLLLTACGGSDSYGKKKPPNKPPVDSTSPINMSAFTRDAYKQQMTDVPLPVDTREITQDISSETEFSDLLQ